MNASALVLSVHDLTVTIGRRNVVDHIGPLPLQTCITVRPSASLCVQTRSRASLIASIPA